MFRVLEIGPDGRPAVIPGDQRVGPPPADVLRWIDLEDQDAAQLDLLAARFGFHPLTIEDCAHFDQRPKLEHYGDYLFIVTHGFRLASEGESQHQELHTQELHTQELHTQELHTQELHTQELHTFLGERYLVTVHAEPIGPLENVWRRLQAEGALGRRGVDFLCYLIADAIVDTVFPLVDQLADAVEDVEEQLLAHTADEQTLTRILRLKRLLVNLRRVLGPQRDVMALLAKRGEGWVSERTAVYFRDVYDHVLRITEAVEATRDLLGNALDAYLWSTSQRTNEIMKRLTILSAVFLPLTFITGFFGQNFESLPYHSNAMLAVMLASCTLVPAGMLYFFLRSKWF